MKERGRKENSSPYRIRLAKQGWNEDKVSLGLICAAVGLADVGGSYCRWLEVEGGKPRRSWCLALDKTEEAAGCLASTKGE